MAGPPVIPDHTLLRLIGRGSYGEVWLARNVMGVLRAVKIISRQDFDSDRPYEREFAGIQRYEPVSRTADGLVHVLHVGRNDAAGYFFYVMELADSAEGENPHSEIRRPGPDAGRAPRSGENFGPGADGSAPGTASDYSPRTLRCDLRRSGRLPVADCLRLALDVVGGLARLHERGLVHRDVKPGNIIYVEGRAKLADVGLVSKGGEGRTFVGTEGYIPPEGPGSEAADLYALGMVLYEAATGNAPEKFPKVPAEWFAEDAGPEPLEFHEIVLKACEGARERRYARTEEMQADLAFLQSGQSVRQLHALERRVRNWRRIGWVAAVTVLVAVGVSFFGTWRARVEAENRGKETQLKEEALTAKTRAEKAERESRSQLHAALLEQARAKVRSGEVGQRLDALAALQRAAAISNTPALRREVFAALALPDLRLLQTLPYGEEYVLKKLDPNFDRIALGRRRGKVEIRSLADHATLASLPATTNLPLSEGRWSSDGRFLALKRHLPPQGRYLLEVWDVTAGRLVLTAPDVRFNAFAFRPKTSHLLTGGLNGWLTTWDLETGHEVDRRQVDVESTGFGYSPDGQLVAGFYERTNDWAVSIHRADNLSTVCSNVFGSALAAIEWHPDGRTLAVTDFGGGVHLMDARSGAVRLLGQHKAEAVTAVFSADGAYLLTGGWERELICWDVASARRVFGIGLDSYQVQFSARGTQCALINFSSILSLYDFERPLAHREFPEVQGSRVRAADFSPDGRWLGASTGQRAAVWDLTGNSPPAVEPEAFNSRFYFTEDGREVYASRGDYAAHWAITPPSNSNAAPRLDPRPLTKPTGLKSLILVSNAVLFNGSAGSQLLPPGRTEAEPGRWIKTDYGILGASPDRRWLAMYRSFEGTLHVYELPDLKPATRIRYPDRIGDFQFSPRGDELAIGSYRTGLTFWNTATWQQTRVLTNFARILYAPDQRRAWLSSDFRRAGLYDLRTLEPLLHLPTGMLPLALSPNGRQIVVSVDSRRLQLWDLSVVRAELAKLGLDWSDR